MNTITVLCSVKCPGKVILATFDLVSALRNQPVHVIGGFHSPMEQECLRLLLRGSCQVMFCYARSIPRRLPPEFAEPIKQGRLHLLSATSIAVKRPTAATCIARNRLAVSLAPVLLVPYANPGGHTEALCHEALAQGKRLLTFGFECSQHLLDAGAQAISTADDVIAACHAFN